MKTISPLLIGISVFTLFSCNQDEPKVPESAITVNILKETYGDFTIGKSDVYINAADNFISSDCGISYIGLKGSLTDNPNLSQVSSEMAVETDCYYQIFLKKDLETVANKLSFPINQIYYNVHVDSWLYMDDEISGAKVTYTESQPEESHLPQWEEEIELNLNKSGNTESCSYSFDKNVAIDPAYEIIDKGSILDRHIEISIQSNKIEFFNPADTPNDYIRIMLNVRYNDVYSKVIFIVNSNR